MKRIPLANGKGIALVDDHHYALLAQFRWALRSNGYATTHWRRPDGGRTTMGMHRLIMGAPPFPGAQVDHINGNKLDNRSANLRWATRSQNQANTGLRKTNSSGYKGVYWHKEKGRWRAMISFEGRLRHIDYYDTAEEAARAYDAAAIELFGEFAVLNFPRV